MARTSMAPRSPCSESRAKYRLVRLSSVLLPAAAVLALALPACSGETGANGLATLVDATTAAETVPESDEEKTVGNTTSTSETTEVATETTTGSTTATTAEMTIETAEEVAAVDDRPAVMVAQPAPVEPGRHDGDARLEEADEDLSDEERLFRFADCMRSNGVDFPDPVVEADGTVRFGFRPGTGSVVESQDLRSDLDLLPAAREACASLLQGLSFGAGSNDVEAAELELQDSLLEFARCMRDHGLDVGDPDLGNFGPGAAGDDSGPGSPVIRMWELSGIDFGDPDAAAALEVCREQVNFGGPRPGGPRASS